MKITKKKLQIIINEEIQKLLEEKSFMQKLGNKLKHKIRHVPGAFNWDTLGDFGIKMPSMTVDLNSEPDPDSLVAKIRARFAELEKDFNKPKTSSTSSTSSTATADQQDEDPEGDNWRGDKT